MGAHGGFKALFTIELLTRRFLPRLSFSVSSGVKMAVHSNSLLYAGALICAERFFAVSPPDFQAGGGRI